MLAAYYLGRVNLPSRFLCVWCLCPWYDVVGQLVTTGWEERQDFRILDLKKNEWKLVYFGFV